jgi:NAD(P)-dependent dehydrogenase (short-subunit alcohol dehydrogenase family)
VAICSRSRTQVESAAEEMAAADLSVAAYVTDVADAVEAQALVDRTVRDLGPPNILVNNAGVQGPIGPTESLDVGAWIDTVRVNLVGTYLCSRSVIPHMRARGGGKIINVAGGGATGPRPFFTAYAAAKTAVVRFTECLAEELRPDNIQVNAISPGAARTALTEQVLAAGAAAGEAARKEALQVFQSGGVDLSKPAGLALFLASSASDRLTGRLISAVWDNWEDWARDSTLIDHLMAGEGGTLRRVRPDVRPGQP